MINTGYPAACVGYVAVSTKYPAAYTKYFRLHTKVKNNCIKNDYNKIIFCNLKLNFTLWNKTLNHQPNWRPHL